MIITAALNNYNSHTLKAK